MPTWAQLLWCALLALLSWPPRRIGARGAAAVALVGVGARAWGVLLSIPTLWMLGTVPLIVVLTFYLMTALWLVFLLRVLRGQPVERLAAWMTRLAVVESATVLNSSAAMVMALVVGQAPRFVLRPVVAMAFAVAQVVFFLRVSKGGL